MYKILIVEDDLLMAQAIQQEMTMWGHEAEYVKDFPQCTSGICRV